VLPPLEGPQPEAKPPEPPPFRVVALVTSLGGVDAVSLCFPTAQNHDRARAIVQRMSQLGGWQVAGLQIQDDRFISVWDESERQKAPEGQLETYVDFSTRGVINQAERWLPLDPFIVALREYSPMRLAVTLGDEQSLEGPGNFEDNTVRIECNRHQGSVVYDITVKNPNLTSTGAPAHAPTPAPALPPAPRQDGGMAWFARVMIALVALAALGVGLALWWKGIWPRTAKNTVAEPETEAAESREQSG
jgi:hypothetical protein